MKRLTCPVHGRTVAATNTGRLVGKCDMCAREAQDAETLIRADVELLAAAKETAA